MCWPIMRFEGASQKIKDLPVTFPVNPSISMACLSAIHLNHWYAVMVSPFS